MDKFASVVVDAAHPASVRLAFQSVIREFGYPTVVIYNGSCVYSVMKLSLADTALDHSRLVCDTPKT